MLREGQYCIPTLNSFYDLYCAFIEVKVTQSPSCSAPAPFKALLCSSDKVPITNFVSVNHNVRNLRLQLVTSIFYFSLYFTAEGFEVLNLLATPGVQDFIAKSEITRKSWGWEETSSPLHVAVFHRRKDFAEKLLKSGANVNILDVCKFNQKYRTTPLHWAVLRNSPEMVKLLLEGKANPNLQGSEIMQNKEFLNLTPLELARLYKHQECIAILENHQKPSGLLKSISNIYAKLFHPLLACTNVFTVSSFILYSIADFLHTDN